MKLMIPKNQLRRAVGFTMIELVICLGIIAFALVAIIGVLPVGINVQKDNREETIIVQDGMYCCLLYTSPSPRDQRGSRMPSSA